LFEYVDGIVDLTGLGLSEIYLFSSNPFCGQEAGIYEFGDQTKLESHPTFGDCGQHEIYLSTMTVSQIPVPAAGFLLLGGLGGLRRRKTS